MGFALKKGTKVFLIIIIVMAFAIVFVMCDITVTTAYHQNAQNTNEIGYSYTLEECCDEEEIKLKVLRKIEEHPLEKKKELVSFERKEPFKKRPKKTLTADDYFAMLPENVRNAFYNNGWFYEQVNYKFGENYGISKSILALTVYRENKIYLSTKKGGSRAILHEVGHAIINIESKEPTKGWYSEEFRNLWSAHYLEWQANYGEHIDNYNTPQEAYAQCVEIYILKPQCLDEDTRNFIASELAAY